MKERTNFEDVERQNERIHQMALAPHFLSCPNVGPRLLSDHGRKKNKFERFPRSRPKLGSQARFAQVPTKIEVPKGFQKGPKSRFPRKGSQS